jgi:hypothetical protein
MIPGLNIAGVKNFKEERVKLLLIRKIFPPLTGLEEI